MLSAGEHVPLSPPTFGSVIRISSESPADWIATGVATALKSSPTSALDAVCETKTIAFPFASLGTAQSDRFGSTVKPRASIRALFAASPANSVGLVHVPALATTMRMKPLAVGVSGSGGAEG